MSTPDCIHLLLTHTAAFAYDLFLASEYILKICITAQEEPHTHFTFKVARLQLPRATWLGLHVHEVDGAALIPETADTVYV